MKNKLFSLHLFASKNKLLFFVILLLLIVSFGFFASKITFQENITKLIPSNDQSKLTSKVLEQVNFSDKTTILIRRKSHGCVDDLSSSASELLDSINLNCNSYIRKIQGKVDEENIQESFNFIYNNLPIFLDENDYKFIENKIHS